MNRLFCFFSIFFLLFLFGTPSQSSEQEQKQKKIVNHKNSKKQGSIGEKIVCDKFVVKLEVKEKYVTVSIDTDLPNDTVLDIWVLRSYYQKGSAIEYARDYLKEESTVGEWRSPRKIWLDNEKLLSELKEFQKSMATAEVGFSVRKISDEVEARFSIPTQSERFGERNKNLVGSSVTIKKFGGYEFRKVEEKITFHHPVYASNLKHADHRDPRNLWVGLSYKISKETPVIIPHLDLSDLEDLNWLTNVVKLKKGDVIKILQKAEKRGTPWYQVQARNSWGQKIADGWIDSAALIGQSLETVD